jgi:AraC-like DNA-binding protein
MINIDFRSIIIAADATITLDMWSLQSDTFSLARLRSAHRGVGVLPQITPHADCLLAYTLQALQPFRVACGGEAVVHPPVAANRLCMLPGPPSTLWVDQPFDLLCFYPRRPQALSAGALDSRDEILTHLMGLLLTAFDHPAASSLMMISHIGLAIESQLGHLGQRREAGAAKGGKLAGWQERSAKEILAANLDGGLTIADIAQQCGLSPAYFTTAFKRSTGKSPVAWLMEQRLQRAKELLRNSGQPLMEIALNCGFFDQSHFTRHFSKTVGTSPGSWRMAQQSAG